MVPGSETTASHAIFSKGCSLRPFDGRRVADQLNGWKPIPRSGVTDIIHHSFQGVPFKIWSLRLLLKPNSKPKSIPGQCREKLVQRGTRMVHLFGSRMLQ